MYKLLHRSTSTVLQAEETYEGERVLSSWSQCAVVYTVKAKIQIFCCLD